MTRIFLLTNLLLFCSVFTGVSVFAETHNFSFPQDSANIPQDSVGIKKKKKVKSSNSADIIIPSVPA